MAYIPSSRSRILLACLASALLALTACKGGGFQFGDQKKDSTAKKEEIVPVEVTTLARGPIEAVLRFSTNLEAEAEVQVFSQASRLVTELLVEEGGQVRQGAVLMRLQNEEQESEVSRIEIELAKAQREFKRQESLFAQAMVSERNFLDAKYEVERLQLALDDARRQLSYTEVRAPIGGTITQRHVNLGDNVQLGQLLFDMVDFDTIVARIFVPERELPRLRVGQSARIYSPSSSEPRVGKVDRISPVVDPQSGTVKVTLSIPRNQGLVPGMYVEVELVVAREDDALLIPKRALVYDDVQSFLYRLEPLPPESAEPSGDEAAASDGEERKDSDADGEPAKPPKPADAIVRRLRVEPMLEDRDSVVPAPSDGLAAGDKVVVAGQAGLKDGAKVRLVEGVDEAASDPESLPDAESATETASHANTEPAAESEPAQGESGDDGAGDEQP